MVPDTGVITSILNDFQNIFTAGLSRIQGDARWLLGALVVIDIALVAILHMGDIDHIRLLIEKILKYGFFIWLVTDYRTIVNAIISGFTFIGLKAGGNGISERMLKDPSKLAEFGIHLTEPIFNHIAAYKGWDALFNLGDSITQLIVAFLIIAAFAVVGIQIFVTYLEFYCIGCLALILIPFGVNQHVSFLGEKAIGAVFSFGIKLMVLAFVASAAVPIVQNWELPQNPSLQQMLYTLLGSLSIAFLAHQAPGVAASLFTGAPSLSAGSAATSLMAGVSAAASVAKVAGSANATMKAAGAITQAAKTGMAAGGGFKGAIKGIGNLAAASSSFGQGRTEASRTMAFHGSALKAAEMRYRLKPPEKAPGIGGVQV